MSPNISRRAYLATVGLVAAGSTSTLAASNASPPRTTAPLDATGWPQYQVDAANTGARSTGGPTADLGPRWSVETGVPATDAAAVHQPAVVDGTAFVATETHEEDDGAGTVAALATDDGTVEWTVETATPRPPAAADGTVYVADTVGLRALDAATGEERWSVARDGPVSTPVVTANTVFVSLPEALYALDREDGSVRWSFGLAGDDAVTQGTPAVGDERVFLATGTDGEDDGDLYALDGRTGELAWTASARSTPAVRDGTVYARGATEDGYTVLRALDAATGEERWQFETGHATLPAVAGDALYLVAGFSTYDLVALDVATGEERWRSGEGDAGVPVLDGRAPVVAGDALALGTTDGLLVVDRGDGTPVDRFTTGDGDPFGWPAVVDDTVYVGTLTNRDPATLYALEAGVDDTGEGADGSDGSDDTGDDCEA